MVPWRVGLTIAVLSMSRESAVRAQLALVGSEIAIGTTGTDQRSPQVATDPIAGTTAVVWRRTDASGGSDVYLRVYNGDGTPRTGETLVSTSGSGCDRAPAVAMDDFGSFVVVWQTDAAGGGSATDILARRFDANGAALGAASLVNTTVAGRQEAPGVARAPDGRFAVVWQSEASGSSGWEAMLRAFGPTGSATSGEVVANATALGAQHSPRVAWVPAPAQSTDGYRVVWETSGTLVGRAFGATGASLGGETVFGSLGTEWLQDPGFATDRSGNALVGAARVTKSNDATRAAYSRFRDTATLQTWTALDAGGAEPQDPSSTSPRADGDFAVAWAVENAAEGFDVRAQAFSNRQVPNGGSVVLNAAGASHERQPAIASSAGGALFAVWESSATPDGPATIRGRRAQLPTLRFHTVTPCRMVDTRDPNGTFGGPILAANTPRNFPVLASSCGLPVNARSLSLNVTITGPPATGDLVIGPGDGPPTGTNNVSYLGGSTRANNAIRNVALNGDGSLRVTATTSVHLILDVNGYFE